MPNIKSAKKRVRSNGRKEKVNTIVTSSMRTAIKKVRAEIKNENKELATAKFNEANKKIDYDRLLLSLSAIDNVDGDVTDSIKQIDSNVEEYTEGTYTITYKASDSAKNESTYNLTVIITSKYSSEDKERLMACFNAYSLIKDRM